MSNDARTFPLPVPPDTWALNVEYLRLLDDYTKRWADKGFEWRFGLEVNYGAAMIADGASKHDPKLEMVGIRMRSFMPRAANDRYALERLGTDRDIRAARRSIAPELIAAMESGEIPASYFSSVQEDPAQIAAQLRAWDSDLSSDDENTVIRAARSLFMAYTHMMDSSKGGMRDLIDARFGNHTHGIGWYDVGESDCEARLSPQADHHTFIGNYHRLLHNLYMTGVAKGVAFEPHYGQTHFSLWEKATGINVMASEKPEHIQLRKALMQGFAHFIGAYPALFNEHDVDDHYQIHHLSTDTDRNRVLRQKHQTWEYRGARGSDIAHLARDLALVMMSTYFGVYAQNPNGEPLFQDDFIQICQKPVPEEPPFYGVNGGIASTIEHCEIDKDGKLVPDQHVIDWNLPLLKREINMRDGGEIRVNEAGEKVDTGTIGGWMAIFAACKIQNGVVMTPAGMDPELADALQGVTITGLRTSLKANISTMAVGMSVYQRLPDVLTRHSFFGAAAGPSLEPIRDFYKDYTATKARQLASRITFALGLSLQKEDHDQAHFYALVWSQIISPSIIQFNIDQQMRVRNNRSKKTRMRYSTLRRHKSVLTSLVPVFSTAVDEEIAHQHANGTASNSVIAQLEDARHDIGNFTRNPRALLQPAMEGTAEYLMEETDASKDVIDFMLAYHRRHIISAFLLVMSDPQVTPAEIKSLAQNSGQWMEEAFARAEAKHPEEAVKPAYLKSKARIFRQHERAVKSVSSIADAFTAGRPATVRYGI